MFHQCSFFIFKPFKFKYLSNYLNIQTDWPLLTSKVGIKFPEFPSRSHRMQWLQIEFLTRSMRNGACF